MKKIFLVVLFFFIPFFVNAEIIEINKGTSTIKSFYEIRSKTPTTTPTTTPAIDIENQTEYEKPNISFIKNKIIDYKEVKGIITFAYYGEKSIIKENIYNKKFVKENIYKRTSNSRTFKIDDNLEQIEVYGKNKFIRNANGYWYNIKEATTTKEIFDNETKTSFLENFFGLPVLATTTDYYAVAGDGRVRNIQYNWSDLHNDNIGQVAYYTSGSTYCATGFDASWNYIASQSFLPFLVNLEEDSIIVSSTLNIYIENKDDSDNDGLDYITVVETDQATTSSLVIGDWNNIITDIDNIVELIDVSERKDITNISTGSWLEFDLNENGINAISTTTYTKLGLIEGHLSENTAYAGAINTGNFIYFATSEDVVNNYPFLTITYVAPTSTKNMEDLETGYLNQSTKYTEVYDSDYNLIGYEYEVIHNPFITFIVLLFVSFIFFFTFLFFLKKINKKNK